MILRRHWSSLSQDQFIEWLKMALLCIPQYSGDIVTVTKLADLYHSVITSILDDLVPVTEMSVCNRPRWPCFDQECKQA